MIMSATAYAFVTINVHIYLAERGSSLRLILLFFVVVKLLPLDPLDTTRLDFTFCFYL
jgi:hypothetical protein